MNYCFDVDGTLTPSRGPMDPGFKQWFVDWASTRNVYLISGSDYPKTLEQVGQEVINAVRRVYSCSGNAVWEHGQLIHQSSWTLPADVEALLNSHLENSVYPYRWGNHLEHRIGLSNFSVVGRDASQSQRIHYRDWDRTAKERVTLASRINEMFDSIEAVVGGEISIDIYARGADKSQVASHVSPFVFFGDHCSPGGNDHTVALLADRVHPVSSWEDTATILQDLYS